MFMQHRKNDPNKLRNAILVHRMPVAPHENNSEATLAAQEGASRNINQFTRRNSIVHKHVFGRVFDDECAKNKPESQIDMSHSSRSVWLAWSVSPHDSINVFQLLSCTAATQNRMQERTPCVVTWASWLSRTAAIVAVVSKSRGGSPLSAAHATRKTREKPLPDVSNLLAARRPPTDATTWRHMSHECPHRRAGCDEVGSPNRSMSPSLSVRPRRLRRRIPRAFWRASQESIARADTEFCRGSRTQALAATILAMAPKHPHKRWPRYRCQSTKHAYELSDLTWKSERNHTLQHTNQTLSKRIH